MLGRCPQPDIDLYKKQQDQCTSSNKWRTESYAKSAITKLMRHVWGSSKVEFKFLHSKKPNASSLAADARRTSQPHCRGITGNLQVEGVRVVPDGHILKFD